MDYVYENRECFAPYITEGIESYVERKRSTATFANHVKFQAVSEMLERPIQVYNYENINLVNESAIGEPIRLAYIHNNMTEEWLDYQIIQEASHNPEIPESSGKYHDAPGTPTFNRSITEELQEVADYASDSNNPEISESFGKHGDAPGTPTFNRPITEELQEVADYTSDSASDIINEPSEYEDSGIIYQPSPTQVKKAKKIKKIVNPNNKLRPSVMPVKCGLCDDILSTASNLKRHVILKHQTKKYQKGASCGCARCGQCQLCSKNLKTTKKLEHHLHQTHNTRLRLVRECSLCCEQEHEMQSSDDDIPTCPCGEQIGLFMLPCSECRKEFHPNCVHFTLRRAITAKTQKLGMR